jgi:hypothetical protein
MRDEKAQLDRIDGVRDRLEAHRPYSQETSAKIRSWFTPRYIGCSTSLGTSNSLSGPEIAAFLEREIVTGGHPLESFLAVRRHCTTLEMVAKRAQKASAIDVGFVQDIHRRLTEGAANTKDLCPGEWKVSPSPVTRRRGHEFVFAPPADVPKLMKQLLEDLDQRLKTVHPVKVMAWFYFHFHQIHPFQSDNGKVARLIATCLTAKFGLPPLMIRPDLVGDYLDALTAVHSTVPPDLFESLSPRFEVGALLEFFCGCLCRTGERMLDIVSGRRPAGRDLAEQVQDSQEQMLAQFLARKSMSWRVGATLAVRELHERVHQIMRQYEVKGSLYTIELLETDVVNTHAVANEIRQALPAGDAGVVGQVHLCFRGNPTLNRALRFPAEQLLRVGVAATEHGLQLIFGWNDEGARPRVQHGPAVANEWPDSTLDDLLTAAIDKRRKAYESTLRERNAPLSQKQKVLRGKQKGLGVSSGQHQVLRSAKHRGLSSGKHAVLPNEAAEELEGLPSEAAEEIEGLRPLDPR